MILRSGATTKLVYSANMSVYFKRPVPSELNVYEATCTDSDFLGHSRNGWLN